MSLEPALNSPEPVDAEISALVRSLNSKDSRTVSATMYRLIECGDAGMSALLHVLALQEKRRARNIVLVVLGLMELLFALLVVAIFNNFFWLLPILTFFVLYRAWTTLVSSTQKQGVELLVELYDVRTVGFLTGALTWGSAEIAQTARYALTHLLTRIKASDAQFLPLERRETLLKQFSYQRSKQDFLLAILKALEQVGGAEAVPVVSRLAEGKGRAAKDSALKQAAQECLPYLEARAEGRELRDTLLRSSSAAEVAPDTLLRPAPTTPTEPENELLRPG